MYYESGPLGTNSATIPLNDDYQVTAYFYIPFGFREEPPEEQ
jgi:hypothetical protein